MTNLKILKATISAVAISLALCESARAACPTGQIEDPDTKHCINTGTSCGGKCTYTFDTVTHDAIITKNPDVAEDEEVILPDSMYNTVIPWVDGGGASGQMYIRNLTIGEGITGAGKWAFAGYAHRTSGKQDGVLTLPSTYKYNGDTNSSTAEFWNLGFGTIDASAVKDTSIYMPVNVNQNIILSPDSNVIISHDQAYDVAGKINIVCKGKKEDCEGMVRLGIWEKQLWSRTHPGENQITSSYYSGPDGNGNWEEWSDSGKAVYADSTKAKLLETYGFDGKKIASYNYSAGGQLLSANTYDSEGNVNGSYTYDAGGNLVSAYQNGKAVYLRKRYTIPEADAATQGKGPFRLDITW